MYNLPAATIAEIKALNSTNPTIKTYYSTDTDKEGVWTLATSTPLPTVNEGTVIQDLAGNRWVRVLVNDEIRPEWFGAKGNGGNTDLTTITDDTTAFSQAIRAARGKVVRLTKGKIYAVTSLIIDVSTRLYGPGTIRRYIKYVDSDGVVKLDETQLTANYKAVIIIDENASDVIVEDILIDGYRSKIEEIKTLSLTPDSPYQFPDYTEFQGISGVSIQKTVNNATRDYVISGVQIKNVAFQNTYDEAVFFNCVENILVADCRIKNCGQPSFGRKNQAGDYEFQTLSALNIQYVKIIAQRDVNVKQTVFENVVVSNCYFDQSVNKNGCIKLPVTDGRNLEKVKIINNTCLMCDNDNIVDQNNTPISNGDDELGIIGIESYTKSGSYVDQLLISGNVIETLKFPDPDISVSTWKGKKFHAFGVSLGGASSAKNRGIINTIVSNNTIKGCRRYGIEVIGNFITVIGNELFDSGYIGVNSKSVSGGAKNIKIIGNSLKTNTGFSQEPQSHGYNSFYSGVLIQTLNNDINDLLIEDNIFDIYHMMVGETDISNFTSDHIYIKSGYTNITPVPPAENNPKIKNLTIIGNHFKSIVRNGVYMESTVVAENVSVVNNHFEYHDTYPTGVTNTQAFAVKINAIKLNTLTVRGNHFECTTNVAHGSAIGLFRNVVYYNILISNNFIKNALQGIYLNSGIDGGMMYENFIRNTPAPAIYQLGSQANYHQDNNYVM